MGKTKSYSSFDELMQELATDLIDELVESKKKELNAETKAKVEANAVEESCEELDVDIVLFNKETRELLVIWNNKTTSSRVVKENEDLEVAFAILLAEKIFDNNEKLLKFIKDKLVVINKKGEEKK